MPRHKGKGVNHKEEKWKVKSPTGGSSSSAMEDVSAVTDDLSRVGIAEQSAQTFASMASASVRNHNAVDLQKAVWKPKCYGTLSGGGTAELAVESKTKEGEPVSSEKSGRPLSALFSGKLLENFTVDNNTYSCAQIRATFYPKFENEKSDQEIRTRMIEMVSNGLAAVEGMKVEHMQRTASATYTLQLVFLFLEGCFVRLGAHMLVKSRQNLMTFLREIACAYQWNW